MSLIEELTPKTCGQLEEELKAAVETIAEKYGIEVKMLEGRLSDDATVFVPRCQFALPERKMTAASPKEEKDYLQYAESFGVKGRWLGKEFKRGNFTYKVVGLRVNETKKCIILERSDGSRCYENGKLVANHLP